VADVYQANTRHEFFDHLQKRFGSAPFTDEMHLDIANRPIVRLYARVSVTEGSLDLVSLQAQLEGLARSWRSDVDAELLRRGVKALDEISARYQSAFSAEYQSLQNAEDAVNDMLAIEGLSDSHPIAVTLANFESNQPHKATIVICSSASAGRDELTISKCVPALESFGFEVVNERTWKIFPVGRGEVHATRFRVRTRSKSAINPDNFEKNVSQVCARALSGTSDVDPLNSLHTDVALPYRAVNTLRAYCRFLWQGSKTSSRIAVMRAIGANPTLAAKLWQMFDLKFNPACTHSPAERLAAFTTESQTLLDSLRSVTDINADRSFRQIRTLIEHTVRTSLYRGSGDSIAIKLDSQKIDFLPQPRPYFEIFVSSPLVEGCHLRAGPVARGGIRWSDRPDDYRTEVLGLMKTQRVKNSLIVPTGAKGGFIPKNLPKDQKLVPETVVTAYKEYIRCLLSITDNRVNGAVVHPESVIVYDSPDPYFVVAADKGTAAFSDTANKIAVEEFNFWLGDAFASGGSNGYDHKLYAITAAGAWECVKRHFRDNGTHADAAPFTAVGIGDMAGDVFGNGLILSRNYKLVAAFNHKHVFIDPAPNPTTSFDERKRLFELKGSQWSDYNPALISNGGGVFNRFEKELRLSPAARKVLGLAETGPDTMSGDEVINAILKAPVDVMWNGGIGTYVKASYQAHSDAGDGANDSVRISATELRARIIGEGGNLGFTQAARIEFNRLGGKLNTDAIDNSGGVDLSDHEVNLKILFTGLMSSGALTREARNTLLKQMAGEVCQLVLDHNRSQALFLSLAERRSARNMPYIARLLRELTRHGYVNRALDNLPEEDGLRERERSGAGMTRPELAVCLSTTKMWVKDVLLESDILESELTDQFCLEYFPSAVVEKFKSEALKHPLRRNIVATQIANTLVDTLGITSLLKLSGRAGKSFAEAVRAAVNAEIVLNTRATRTALLRNEANLSGEEYLAVNQQLATTLGQLTAWFLARHDNLGKGAVSYAELKQLHDQCRGVFSGASKVLPDQVADQVSERIASSTAKGVDQRDAQLLAWCSEIVSLIEVLWVLEHTPGKTAQQASAVYFSLLQATGCQTLIKAVSKYAAADGWEAELLPGLASDLRYALATGTIKALQSGVSQLDGAEQLRRTIDEALRTTVRASTLAVFTRQVVALLER
jgi:glutamate dehydrogenase